ncbi:MAG: hypothetical protein WBS24_14245 [Terriglobales bacterium]
MSGREHGHELPLPHGAPPAPPVGSPTQPDLRSHLNDELEVVPGFERENLQGWIPALASEADIRAVIEKAFDYRGDVTVTRKDGSQLSGYLFDRRIGKTLGDSVIRLMLASSNDRPAIPYSDIAGIAFTGRDTAAGKTYEAWVKKYWESRAKGEKNISIEPEALE